MHSIGDSKRHIQEYDPVRVNPIYTYITKKYLSEENVVSENDTPDGLNTLTFNIKENDPTMVLKSVRLCIPVEVAANSNSTEYVDFRIADQLPACNLALAASAYEAFSDIQLIANGSCFSSQPNRYQGMLERVYRARDVLSFQSGGSLKPIVSRNLKKSNEANSVFPVLRDDEKAEFVQIHETYSSVSRNAFDLTQTNPGFVTRAAKFQQDLNGSSYLAKTLLEMYVDIGIFQNKERVLPSGKRLYNDACPYLRDVMLRFTFDKLRSKFDAKHDQKQKGDVKKFENRDFPSKILEFATPVNSIVSGEPDLPDTGWLTDFYVVFNSRPYLEVQYVQVPEHTLKPSYSLMAIRHQHEVSDPFHFGFSPIDEIIEFPKVTQRLNSRLLEVPSKIYVWAGLSFNDKKSFFLGNTGNQRYCKIDRLHLRMNTRTDALFEPTQLECYNIFKRVSLNDMNYQTWSKSPIYVFDPQALGQPEFLASDGQLMTFDWDCEISPTGMQYEEMLLLQDSVVRKAMGYDWDDTFHQSFSLHGQWTAIRKYVNYIPNPTYTVQAQAAAATHAPWGVIKEVIPNAPNYLATTRRSMHLAYYFTRDYSVADSKFHKLANSTGEGKENIWTKNTEGRYIHRWPGQRGTNGAVQDNDEIMTIHNALESRVRFDNLIWAIWDGQNNVFLNLGAGQTMFWYVPESWLFTMTPSDYGYVGNMETWQSRDIFLSLDDVSFAGDGTVTLPAAKRPVDADDNTGKYIVKGIVSLLDTDGSMQTRDFNKLTAAQKGQYCPGPRAYPLAVHGANAQRVFSGIRNIGFGDGGTGVANTNNAVRGGLPPEAIPANQNNPSETYYKMINPTTGGAQQQYYWVAFQPTQTALADVNAQARFVAWNTDAIAAGQFVGVNAVNAPCGGISRVQVTTPVAQGQPGRTAPKAHEVHVVKTVVKRGAAGTALVGANYTRQNDNRGIMFESKAARAGDQSVTDALDWELNVLYEFGNEKYIVSKQGPLIQDSSEWTPTVVQKRARTAPDVLRLPASIPRDPRLQGIPKLERVKSEPRASGFHSHY